MDKRITSEDLIAIVEKSDLDQTIKHILVRDIKNEGVNDFLLEQVIAYCDNAIEVLEKQNPPV
jgi:hypothetical protein